MIVAHIMGIPVEETLPQLAPVGAVTLTAIAVVGRAKFDRPLERMRRRLWKLRHPQQ
jgi:hypothetical protein